MFSGDYQPVSSHRRKPWLLFCVLFGVLSLTSAAFAKQDEQKLQQLRAHIEQLQSKIKSAQGEQSKLSGKLKESEQQIGRLTRKLRVLAGRLKRQKVELKILQEQADAQSRALADEQQALAQQVRAAHAMGRQESLKIILNQQDPAAISRMMVYFDYLNRERMLRMQGIRDRLQKLQQTRASIRTEEQQLVALQAQQTREKADLEQQQLARREVLRELDGELKSQGRQLTRLRQDEKQLQTLLQGLQDALQDIPAEPVPLQEHRKFAELKGRLRWPSRGYIGHRFGSPKIGKLRWDGVMISSTEGSDVRAVHAGRVAFADWLRGFGLLLIVDHGDGYMTLYGHNQSLFKEAGDWVDGGEPVAAVGDTGGRKEPGVYFAIRRHGKAVNPAKWCRRPRGRKVG